MSHVHEFNESAGVCAGDNETDLTDNAVHNILIGCLLQSVGIDRQGCDVPVLHQQLGCLTTFRLIEGAIGINTILAILQKSSGQECWWVRCAGGSKPGNRLPITILECVMADRPSIGADKIVWVAQPLKSYLGFILNFSSFGCYRWLMAACPFGALRLLFLSSSALGPRRLHADLLPDLVGGHDLVSSHLVGDLGDVVDGHQSERVSEEQDRLLL